jgi:hypothetical protein
MSLHSKKQDFVWRIVRFQFADYLTIQPYNTVLFAIGRFHLHLPRNCRPIAARFESDWAESTSIARVDSGRLRSVTIWTWLTGMSMR